MIFSNSTPPINFSSIRRLDILVGEVNGQLKFYAHLRRKGYDTSL